MVDFNFNKFSRYYDGGYTFTFYNALSGVVDVKNKNHTNFILTRNTLLSEIIDKDDDKLKSESILTSLNFGGVYLKYELPNTENLGNSGIYTQENYYGDYSFSNEESSPRNNFILTLKNDNYCNIHHFYDYEKYYLTENDGELNFYTSNLGLTGIDFKYIYSEPNNAIFLFRNLSGIPHLLSKNGNKLSLTPSTSANKTMVYSQPIILSKNIYTDYNNDDNTTFIEYDTDNNIDNSTILKNLPNNYLLHREYDSTDIIVLKNQLTQNGVFNCGNTLLSSDTEKFFVKDMRNYVSISNDIGSVTDEDLSLNYVFYNKPYIIKPGKNAFKSPTDLTPFTQININDTKFIESGAFAYPTPEFADKVYRLDTSVDYKDNQIYLCTWLSGSPLTNNKVWVDRYYYPDYIEKKLALVGNNTFNKTYDDVVEELVANNTSIQDSISSFTFFDKKSDMVFIPNQEYIYERISKTFFEKEETVIVTPCQNLASSGNTINYFKQLNDVGQFTVSFYFEGDAHDWKFESKRNNTNGGLSIIKNGPELNFSMNLFNPGTEDFLVFNRNANFKRNQKNFLSVSIDVIKGILYFFLNNEVLESYTFPEYQYYGKRLIFGDFIINNQDVFNQNIIKKVKITSEYTPDSYSFIQPILDGETKVDDMTITLPCGMRNSVDEIEYLQSVCNNQSYKSSHINIYLKDLQLNPSDESNLKTEIINKIMGRTALNTNINNVKLT